MVKKQVAPQQMIERIQIRITPNLKKAIEIKAAQLGLTVADFIRSTLSQAVMD